MNGQTYGVNENWLADTTGGAYQMNASGVNNIQGSLTQTVSYGNTTGSGLSYFYPTVYQWWPYVSYPITTVVTEQARPIKLTLSEVDKLRRAAKVDAGLRAILQKFTDQIEVAVDFKGKED